jgi:hypothetical protein
MVCPDIRRIENEHPCMRLTAALGLPTAQTQMREFNGTPNFAKSRSNSDRPSGIHQDTFARFRETVSWARSMKARKLAAMWRRPG